jgi:hypothetical protein
LVSDEYAGKYKPFLMSTCSDSPICFFAQAYLVKFVLADLQSQHLLAISVQMSLSNTTADNNSSVQHITNASSTGASYSQFKIPVNSAGMELTHVHVFFSLDNALTLNMLCFDDKDSASEVAARAGAKQIYEYAAELKAGKHAADKSAQVYSNLFSDIFSDASAKSIAPNFADKRTVCRFLIQRATYERAQGGDGAEMRMEHFAANSFWVTIVAANVLPEALLRLSNSMITTIGLDVTHAHLDSVTNASNNVLDDKGIVAAPRPLVFSNDVSSSISLLLSYLLTMMLILSVHLFGRSCNHS